MNGNEVLLDTNIVLYLLDGDETLAEFLNEKRLYISIITEIELLSFWEISEKEQIQIQNFLSDCLIININPKIKDESVIIRKKFKSKLPDSIIAATSLYLDLPLITSDSGFKKFDNIQLIHYEI